MNTETNKIKPIEVIWLRSGTCQCGREQKDCTFPYCAAYQETTQLVIPDKLELTDLNRKL